MADPAYIRTFICFEIPNEIREKFRAIQSDLKTLGRGVNWTNPNGIHLTLKFLGDVERDVLPDVADAVKNTAAKCRPMSIELAGTGAFPNMRQPRVYWVGVNEPSGALVVCQAAVELALEPLGFPRERRKFSPHLTLGRVKSPDGITEISDRLSALQVGPMTFQASEMIIMSSELKPSGAVYTPLYRITL